MSPCLHIITLYNHHDCHTTSSTHIPQPWLVQAQALPVIMSGRDCIGIAKTGSGKTLAFILPMLRHIKDQRPIARGDGPIALIMAPTRELVQQIGKEVCGPDGCMCASCVLTGYSFPLTTDYYSLLSIHSHSLLIIVHYSVFILMHDSSSSSSSSSLVAHVNRQSVFASLLVFLQPLCMEGVVLGSRLVSSSVVLQQ